MSRLYFFLMYWMMASSISLLAMRTDLAITMPEREMTATSVVPPPMSTIMLPPGSVIGRSAPMAAAMACSIRKTSLALARRAASRTARRSTSVISEGMPITMRGLRNWFPVRVFLMKYCSIFSVISKSAITPSFIGRMARIFAGVLPSMSLASDPTAWIRPLRSSTTTMEGSRRTMPRPRIYTSVLAVPRSIARSEEK